MSIAACLLFYSMAVVVFGPSALGVLTRSGHAPRSGVAVWLIAIGSVLLTWLTVVVLVILDIAMRWIRRSWSRSPTRQVCRMSPMPPLQSCAQPSAPWRRRRHSEPVVVADVWTSPVTVVSSLILGGVIGTLLGLPGGGGSILAVPALVYFFHLDGLGVFVIGFPRSVS